MSTLLIIIILLLLLGGGGGFYYGGPVVGGSITGIVVLVLLSGCCSGDVEDLALPGVVLTCRSGIFRIGGNTPIGTGRRTPACCCDGS